MSRRPATVTQADLARVIRAAKQEGVAVVEVRIGEAVVVLRTDGRETAPLEPARHSMF